MRIAYGTDDTTAATESLRLDLEGRGHEVLVVADGVDWPDAGRAVGEAVASGRADRGVVWCWTGTGVVMAATKVPGVRAALVRRRRDRPRVPGAGTTPTWWVCRCG